MSTYWNFTLTFAPGTTAKAEDVNTNLSGIDAGLDLIETEIGKTVQITNGAGVTDIVLNAAGRANKLLEFDANGDIAATTIMGDWNGDHANAAGTDYQIRDVVSDAAGSIKLGSLYICNETHTSTGSLATDTAKWDLLIDATNLTTLGGLLPSQYLRSDTDDTFTGTLTVTGALDVDATQIDSGTIGTSSGALTLSAASGVVTVGTINFVGGNTIQPSSGSMTLQSTSGNVTVESVTFNGGVVTGVTDLTATGDVTLAATKRLYLDGGTDTYIAENSADEMVFRTNGSSRLILTNTGVQAVPLLTASAGIDLGADGRIKFPATANPSGDANTLDDYQEGEWTATLVPSSSGTITLSSVQETLAYTKIGRVVYIQGRIGLTGVSSPVGATQLKGLPFTNASLTDQAEELQSPVFATNMATDPNGFVVGKWNGADIDILKLDTTNITAELQNLTTFTFNFFYFTDQ